MMVTDLAPSKSKGIKAIFHESPRSIFFGIHPIVAFTIEDGIRRSAADELHQFLRAVQGFLHIIVFLSWIWFTLTTVPKAIAFNYCFFINSRCSHFLIMSFYDNEIHVSIRDECTT